MDREDQRRYFVVGSVFMEIVTPLFRKKVENDYTNKGFGSFHAFINSQAVKHILFHLRHRNTCCCQDQVHCFNSRALPVNYSQWDLLYTENPGPGPHNCHFTTPKVKLQKQNTLWTDLESFILQLDPSKEDDLIRLQQRPLDQQLCDKYLICLLDLHKKLDEMDTKLDHQTELLQEIHDVLRNQTTKNKSLFLRGLSSLLKLFKSKQQSDQPAKSKLGQSDKPAQLKLGQSLFTHIH